MAFTLTTSIRGSGTMYLCRRWNRGYGYWAVPGDRQHVVWRRRESAEKKLAAMLAEPSGEILYHNVHVIEIAS